MAGRMKETDLSNFSEEKNDLFSVFKCKGLVCERNPETWLGELHRT